MVFLLIYFDVWSTIMNSLIFFLIKQYKIYFSYRYIQDRIRKVCNISKFPIKTYRNFAFICLNCTRVKICSTSKEAILHPEANSYNTVHMAKNTPGVQLCTPGANLHPGANCAYEPSFRRVKRGIKAATLSSSLIFYSRNNLLKCYI